MQVPIFCPNFPQNMDRCEMCQHNIGNIECALTYLHKFEIEDMLGVNLPEIKNK